MRNESVFPRHYHRPAQFLPVALSIIAICQVVYAQREDPARPEAFARPFVAAVNSGQLQNRHALLHPAVAACVTAANRTYFDSIFARQARNRIPADYRLTASRFSSGEAPLSDGRSPYALPPTHQLQIDYGTPLRSTTMILLVAHDGDRWRQVLGCPSAETVSLAARTDAERERSERRARALADAIAEPLRGELRGLIAAGRRVDATRRYAAASGEDLTMSRRVIDLLTAR